MTRLAGMRLRGASVLMALATLLLLFGLVWSPRVAATADLAQGPGGPILVVTSSTSTYGTYYAEILRAEGLNTFAVADINAVSAAMLANYDVVVVAPMPLTSAQADMFTTWVNGGGNLIAMAPDSQLDALLGLTSLGTTLSDGYLLIDTSAAPGAGIVNQTMQYHGTARRYTLSGASSVATLYSNATTATTSPAVTLRSVGSGKAASFAYDLATSIVYTRQGNPAWATQERDGFAPIRSDDKFFGNAAGDPQPDWIDLSKVAIPQADEQQRLFANLILHMNLAKKPLPRFWYFPDGKKAVIVMTGDDHGNGGTVGRFDQFRALSTPGCSVANWECIRGTSYIYTSTPLTNAQAVQYNSEGFEVGIHINTSCGDFTAASLEAFYSQQLPEWQAKYSSIPAPITQRHHCIAWSDWASGAQVQFNHGMRLDTSYYFWPPSWVANTPGVFTGSAMPMRFAALNGSIIDVYMAATQMTDESGQAYPLTPDTLLDRAIGPEGYYGAYVINAHTDVATGTESDTTVASAVARGVPVISSRQLLTWVDGRNSSTFSGLTWNGSALSFTVTPGIGANRLQGMLPARSATGVLSALTRGGTTAVPFTVSTIKGIDYATFAADAGTYVATYAIDGTAPSVTSTSPANGASNVSITTAMTATFSEPMSAATINPTTFELRNAANAVVAASVAYDGASRTATLTPTSALAGSSTYTVTIRGGATDPRVKDLAGNALAANVTWSFTTAAGPTCPCGAWDATATPAVASENDPNPVELGVKFRSDVDGFITGIRFYKGTGNTGTHIGNLWTASGQLLGSATFTGETASGWQQVSFASPVAITANTTYVASYFAPNGRYAADGGYFANGGVDRPPIRLLSNAAAGGNGVYAYSSTSTFPSSTFNSTNYWVDVVFTTTGPVDTTPPTVTATSPANGAVGVGTSNVVTATFSEAMDAATINGSTFELRTTTGGALVAATVNYNAASRVATLTPSAALLAGTSYTATVKGGTVDPRVKDSAGNALTASMTWTFTTGAAGGSCASPANPIVAENCLTGNPASEWDVNGAGDASIQGFATQISVNKGTTVQFKVSTNAASYRFDIYRLGYYGGLGARKVATVNPSATLPQSQPSCLNDANTGLIDCGNWAVSGSWAVPATAVSGIYVARLVRADTGGASHIVFIVRDDASTSDLVFQTSDTTWQAYNTYGGNSLYAGSPVGRAYKVSYNRPFNTRSVDGGQDWLFYSEYPMVRWLEANGYNVSYISGVDTDRFGSLLLNHRVFLSVGHDEYWSGNQRANVEAARNAGVNLAFFSGNEVFWKTRWENSIDGSATPYRTLVSYKETHANAKIDPDAAWTGTWRDPRFSPPADGGRPENALTGTIFMANDVGTDFAITVPSEDGKMRLWRNTSVASLAPGQTATLPVGTLGYEWDVDLDNGARPAGLFRMSSTTLTFGGVLQDFGSTYGSGTLTHSLTMYRHASGARVFGAGTIQWSWGLDATHDQPGTPADVRMQQATVNLLADMQVQPATLQSGLVSTSASTDSVAPVSAIATPADGANVAIGSQVAITGTATDVGGVAGGVEVSTDGGTTWRRANGRANWSYTWTPSAAGIFTIRTRAVDDSGNLEVPGVGRTVTVGGTTQTCPCTIWPASATPVSVNDPDTGAVNLGVKFQSDQDGFITGVRFYKGTANTGTHIGALWSSGGTLLASATFTNETASGWQQVTFSSPVAITANTVYVASYLAPVGRYAGDNSYFATTGVDNAPLRALRDGVSGGNGLYAYSPSLTFPNSTWQSSNYWVDVVFVTGAADTTPPTITSSTPANGATGVAVGSMVTATFSEAMNASTVSASTFELRAGGVAGTLVSSTVSYNATTRVATLTPSSALAAGTGYTAIVKGGAAGVKDAAGNALVADATWSFTTAAADTTPPTVTANTPANGATGVATNSTVTATFSESLDAATVSGSTFELRNAAGTLVTATVSYNATTRVATLAPAAVLATATTYTATVRGGTTDPRIKDLSGNALATNVAWSFTTVAGDATPPTVTATSPASGATGVSATANVSATFSEAMDAATITTTTFELRDAANALVAATVSYNATSRVATLNPTPTLVAGATYTATMRGGTTDPRVKDVAGNALAANVIWSFTIAPDVTAPTVTATSPANGATGVSRTANITATFSEAMNPTTVNTTTFELRDASNTLIAATVTMNAANTIATLNPTPTLAAGTTFTVTVRGGAAGVKDQAGNALAVDRVWTFTTVVDNTAPTVTSTSPAAGATGVSRTANITATFSEAMNATTITASTFELRTSAGVLVPAVVTINAANTVATLNPNATLGALTTYTATVRGGAAGVKDQAGNALAIDRVWSFTTR